MFIYTKHFVEVIKRRIPHFFEDKLGVIPCKRNKYDDKIEP